MNKAASRADFWKWFISASADLSTFIRNKRRDYRIYDQLTLEMRRIHPDLTPELTVDDAEFAVLVISCDGKQRAIEEVTALADCAPIVPGWRVQRFRMPMKGFATKYKGLEGGAEDVRVAYAYETALNKVHVRLYIRGYVENDERYKALAFLSLDHSIGEYNTMMHIGGIEFADPNEARPSFKLISLDELRQLIERECY